MNHEAGDRCRAHRRAGSIPCTRLRSGSARHHRHARTHRVAATDPANALPLIGDIADDLLENILKRHRDPSTSPYSSTTSASGDLAAAKRLELLDKRPHRRYEPRRPRQWKQHRSSIIVRAPHERPPADREHAVCRRNCPAAGSKTEYASPGNPRMAFTTSSGGSSTQT